MEAMDLLAPKAYKYTKTSFASNFRGLTELLKPFMEAYTMLVPQYIQGRCCCTSTHLDTRLTAR